MLSSTSEMFSLCCVISSDNFSDFSVIFCLQVCSLDLSLCPASLALTDSFKMEKSGKGLYQTAVASH